MSALPLVEVVVHRDGALVTRKGSLPVSEGRILCTALPLLLEPGSLRAAIQGPRLLGMRLGWDLKGLDRSPLPEVTDAWVAAKRALAVLQAEHEVLQGQRQALASLGPQAETEAESPTPSAQRVLQWTRLDGEIDGWAAELDERLTALQRKISDAQAELQTLQHQVDAQSSEAFWRHWVPTRQVTLEVEGDGEAQVELSYRIPGATWTPSYQLDTDGLFRRGLFIMRGLVAQRTGEDWDGVRLHLSTAPSTRRIALPELPALRLGRRQAPSPSPWRPLPDDLETLFPEALGPLPQARLATAGSPHLAEAPAMSAVTLAAPLPLRKRRAVSRAPSPPAPQRAESLADAAVDSDADGAAPAEAPATVFRPDNLDYGNLRLRDWTAGPGERGRLRPAGPEEALSQAGLPSAAARRLAAAQADARRLTLNLVDQQLPPHHVLPGPVQDAHFRFSVEAPAQLPSDGRFHHVTVFSEPIELTVHFRAIPRLDSRVYRSVQARMSRSTPLLAGPIDVHIDGSLALSTPWAGTPGRGQLSLDLGVEDGIRIARNVRYREESAGLFGKSRRQFTTVEVKVASTLPRPARVQLLERIPVASHDEVVVEQVQSDPPTTPYTGERDGPLLRGGVQQLLQIPPGGEREATLTWALTLGAQDELEGGNRRG